MSLPLDHDNDLVQVAGQSRLAAGSLLHLGGYVLDPKGRPLPGYRVEIWQCDAFGVYHHPGGGGQPDPGFQGFGHAISDADGAYRFRTIVPVAYVGRTPHIHVKIKGQGFEALTTQMYIAGHPDNEKDQLYRRLKESAARVSVPLEPVDDGNNAMRGRFDIVLGADGTPFENG